MGKEAAQAALSCAGTCQSRGCPVDTQEPSPVILFVFWKDNANVRKICPHSSRSLKWDVQLDNVKDQHQVSALVGDSEATAAPTGTHDQGGMTLLPPCQDDTCCIRSQSGVNAINQQSLNSHVSNQSAAGALHSSHFPHGLL